MTLIDPELEEYEGLSPGEIASQERRHKAELAKRRKVKKALIEQCPEDKLGRKLCPRCGKLPDIIGGLQLSHKVSLARGGKTNLSNCEVLCRKCHAQEHMTEDVPKSQPIDKPVGITALSGYHGTGQVYNFSREMQARGKR